MIIKIASTIGSLTFISRILGYFRDLLFAKYFGAGLVSDSFFVAFKLPNLFRRLFAEGAMNSAFIPVISGIQINEGKASATKFLCKILIITFSILLPLVIVVNIFMPILVHLIAPGFDSNLEKFNLTVLLSRITFPFLIFVSLSSLIGGFLSTLNKFAAMAFTPVILNLIMIFTLSYSGSNNFTSREITIYVAYSISIAGLIQFCWLIYNLKKNEIYLRIKFFLSRKIFSLTEPTKKLFKIFLPAVVGNGIYQINLLIDMVLASTLSSGSISYLYFSDRINQLPLGVLGISISTALLPLLSRQIKQEKVQDSQNTMNECVILCFVVSIPAAFGIFMISYPLLDLLFVRGEFTSSDAQMTNMSLKALCIGLPAFILIKVLSVIFFSREDTKTPVKVGFFSMLINLTLNLILIKDYQHVGLALATSISAWFNVLILYLILRKKKIMKLKKKTVEILFKSLISATIMYLLLKNLIYKYLITDDFLAKFSFLSMIILLGAFVYFALMYLFKVPYLKSKR